MKMLTLILASSALLSTTLLSGCTMTQSLIDPNTERSTTRSFRDITAARAIKSRMLRVEGFELQDVTVDIDQGIVVLAGSAPREEDKVEAERIAWSAPGITQIGNEIYVGRSLGFFSKTKDEIISTSVRTKLATSSAVRNLNYQIETRDGVVYLLGVARNEDELTEAARLASITRGVKEVVSYATLQGQMPNSFYGGEATSHVASSTNKDLSFWGTPVTNTGSMPSYDPSSDTIPYSPIGGSQNLAPIYDQDAPLPYRPGISEVNPDTMGPRQLDSDAIESGEPYYVDPQTGQRIELPPGVKPIPYVPDMGPGSLGAGGAPLPPGVTPPKVLGVNYNEPINSQPNLILPASTYSGTYMSDISEHITTAPTVTQRYIYTPSPSGVPSIEPEIISNPVQNDIHVIWNGSAWVEAP